MPLTDKSALMALIKSLTGRGILTGSGHSVLSRAGIQPNDLDIIIPNSTVLENKNWIKSICDRFDFTFDETERAFLNIDGVKVVDLIFVRGSVKSETYDGIECVPVAKLLKQYQCIGDLKDRTGKNDNIKIEILEKYLSQPKLSSPSKSPSHRLKKSRISKSLLFHTPKKLKTTKSLSFEDDKENVSINY